MSRDLGFAVRLCRPYRAKTKGNAERRPVDRLEAEQRAMLPYEPAMAPIEAAARLRLRSPLPVESLQHPPSAR